MLSPELLDHVTVVGRECGKCSLCCKVLKVIELEKPEHVWCKHCRPGAGGCMIHASRPNICRGYFCGWMLSKNVGDEWYPLKSHMVLSIAVHNGLQTVTVTCDNSYPLAWLEPPYYAQLKQMCSRGLKVARQEDIHLVHVRSAGRVWLMLPNKDVEITSLSYVLKLVAQGAWDVEMYATSEEADARTSELSAATRLACAAHPEVSGR